MDITEIIKNALIFPSKNLETLSIFAILSLFSAAFAVEGVVSVMLGIMDIGNLLIGAIYIIIAVILGLITTRISIQCVKSGIDLEEKLPDFKWWGSLGIGVKKIIITIFYFLIPALIVVFVGLITNIIGNIINIRQSMISQAPSVLMGNSTIADAVYQASFPLFVSLAIIITVAFIILLIFSFFQTMGEARLANTGSLKEALNIFESARDIKKIGLGKLILLSILIFVIFVCIEAVLTVIFDHFVVLSILNIVIAPYITLFSQRALGLLYSEIV